MVYTTLSLDDFLGVEFMAHRSSPMDYLLAVSEVAWLKSMCGEQDNLIAEQDRQFRIKKQERITHNTWSILSSFPQLLLLDRKENSVLDLVVPRGKRSVPNARPRKEVTERFFSNGGGELMMIKKAVEINSEEEQRVFEIDWGAGVSNQEFFQENRVKGVHDDWGNRVFKINLRGSVNFAFENPKRQLPIIRKRSRQVAANDPSEATRKKKIVRAAEAPPVVVMINRELDIEFKNLISEIGGCLESAKLVIEKRLFESDVKPGEGRLSIPTNQMSNKFLKPEEEARLNTRNGAKMCEMNVMLIEPSRRIGEINLRKWFMNKDNGKINVSYVLVTYWNEVTRRNDLKTGTKVQLWAFRKGETLCFALVKV